MTMPKILKLLIFFSVITILLTTEKIAVAGNYYSYALIIGSNRAPTGEKDLKYTHFDAYRMQNTLLEVGRIQKKAIKIILDPDKQDLIRQLDYFRQLLNIHKNRDEKTEFIFYYSGHANSTKLLLGSSQLSFKKLKTMLTSINATVKLVILDACETGSFSNIKGIQQSQGFSSNMTDDLNIKGTAVISSSSGSELSQESGTLKGSYFSHYLSLGLRGAADFDKNGAVTLNEAYKYAYNQTLASTVSTRIGRQHATLEMNIKGKGEMTLSWPGKSSAKLKFLKGLEGSILLIDKTSRMVAADIRKVKTDSFTVSLRPGDYKALVRINKNTTLLCHTVLKEHSTTKFNIKRCQKLVASNTASKGDKTGYRIVKQRITPRREYIFAEFQGGFFTGSASEYTDRLKDFGYTGLDNYKGFAGVINLLVSPLPYLSVGFVVANMDRRSGDNNLTGVNQSVSWKSYRFGGFIRGNLTVKKRLLVPYVQFGAGGTRATLILNYNNESGTGSDTEHFKSGYFSAGAGLQINLVRWFGITLINAEYIYSTTLKMQGYFDEKHNNGGVAFTTGVRFGY